MSRKTLDQLLRRLSDLSVKHAYDPHAEFDWPNFLPEDMPWMSPELLSVHGTEYARQLTPEQLRRLSQSELVNFFSFNVHGIRELMLQVLSCIYRPGYEPMSEYFHHFLNEENKHMWFFAEFCKRYGRRIYAQKRIPIPNFVEEDIQSFLAFAKILISEQISDFYNVRMMTDASLPLIVQKINRVHHQDEGRHIAMGLSIVEMLYDGIKKRYAEPMRYRIASYLRGYMQFFVQSFYSPSAYQDAGLSNPYQWRERLMGDPVRVEFHKRVLSSTQRFFSKRSMREIEVV